MLVPAAGRAGPCAGLSGQGARRLRRRRHRGGGARRDAGDAAPTSRPRCAPPMRPPRSWSASAAPRRCRRRTAPSRPAGRRARAGGQDRVRLVGARRAARRMAPRSGLRIGFTNGCFDLLHPGHVKLMAEARARLRPAGGRPQQRCLGDAPQGRGPADPGRRLARRSAGRARSGRSRRGVRGGHAARADPAGAPGGAGQGRRLRARQRWSATTIVEADGGEVILVDLVPGHSTSGMVARSGGAAKTGT